MELFCLSSKRFQARLFGQRSIAATFWILCILAIPENVAASVDSSQNIYVAQAIVTGTDLRDRPRGLALCLAQVLVNVSGDPNILSRIGVKSFEARAETMVTGLYYVDRMSGMHKHDEQGTRDRPFTLTATFDPKKVTAVLAAIGAKPRTGARPAVFLITQVQGYAGNFLLSAGPVAGYDIPELMRAAIGDAAWQYKLEVTLPTSAQEIPPTNSMVVEGNLIWSDTDHGWIATWDAGSVHWTERGVSFDDAFRKALAGALGIASGYGPPAR